jgi:hypothetical protein
MGALGRDGAGVQIDDRGPPGLRRAFDQPLALPLDHAHTAPDGDPGGIQVNVPHRSASRSQRRIPVDASSRHPMA